MNHSLHIDGVSETGTARMDVMFSWDDGTPVDDMSRVRLRMTPSQARTMASAFNRVAKAAENGMEEDHDA